MLGNLINMRLPVSTLEEFVDKPRYLNFEEKNLQMEFKTLQMEFKLEQEIKARNLISKRNWKRSWKRLFVKAMMKQSL